jgi:hypothetical protein
MNTSEREALDLTDRVASNLVHTMCAANGLNEFFENALPPIAGAFGAKRVIRPALWRGTDFAVGVETPLSSS